MGSNLIDGAVEGFGVHVIRERSYPYTDRRPRLEVQLGPEVPLYPSPDLLAQLGRFRQGDTDQKIAPASSPPRR